VYEVKTPAVYIHERALSEPTCSRRVDRLMHGIESARPPEVVDDARLDEVAEEHGWSEMVGLRTGEIARPGDPIILLNTFRWLEDEEWARLHEAYPRLRHYYLSGNGAWTFRNGEATLRTQSGVCTNAYELHAAWGCLHNCDYCNVPDLLNIMVNLEELVARFQELVEGNRWLKLWKFDNHTDTITLEPEYEASELMVDLFSRQDDQYLMMYTKSANVDHLLELDHRGKTIVCWSLAPDTQSRLIEKNAATCSERIEAARKCQEAGYTVRARLSPIVPVRGWQAEADAMLSDLLGKVFPDVITIDTLKWTEPTRVWRMFDKSLWDDEYAGYVDQYAAMPPQERPYPILPNGKQLFPHEARVRMYGLLIERIQRLSPRTRIAFCGETPEIWAEFADQVGMTPDNYVCACGPTSVPGHALFST